MDKLTEIPFLFIVGRPRSGTTLLRTLFDAHTNVVIPPECQFVVNLYGKYGKKTFWSKTDLEHFYQELQTQWRFELWKLDNDLLMKRLLTQEGQNSYGNICKTVYGTYASVFPKQEVLLFGDKNPGYTIYTKRLLKIFPNAKFIHITRDYRDNFVSIKNVDFELPLPALAGQKWVYFYKKIHHDAQENPEAYFHIRYEDLVSNPESNMKAMCSFAGIEYQPGILNFHEKKDDVMKLYSPVILQKYQASLLKKINTNRIGLWKKELTEKEIRLLDYTVGAYAEKSGYQKINHHFSPVIALQALPGRAIAALLYVATQTADKLPASLRMTILSKGPRLLGNTFLRIFNPKKLKEMNTLLEQEEK
ncbi:MAG: sulfotransferase [Bacteroidales bacterium]|nr:sulfotransferase [Bacteroidales bacterium]